jgi:hypothetical protein
MSAVAVRERLGAFEKGAAVLLAVAALVPASAPTAEGLVNPDSYSSVWSIRVGGGPNLIELGLVVLALVWVGGLGRRRAWASALDRPVIAFGALVVALQLVALLRNGAGIEFMALDVERIGLVLAGYFLITQLDVGERRLHSLVALIGGALAASFAWLTIRHGLLGSTEFGTVSGRRALLITEDSLLVTIPVVLGWGLVVDRLVRGRRAQAVLGFMAVAVVVNLLSLRRGGLIFLTAALAVRSLALPRRWLLTGTAVVAVGAGLAVAAGPARPVADQVSYIVKSSLLRSHDRSTSQREAELTNFGRNLHGPADVVLGRGLGAVWNAEVGSAVDVASFGSGETDFVRVGWHVYGLDWLYKLGALGALGAVLLVGFTGVRLRGRLRELRDPLTRSLVSSLAVVVPVLLLFTFTNPRVALFAGVVLGLTSKLMDGETAGAAA